MEPPFVLDSNFFIQAHRFHYPMDIVPGFWTKVKELAHNGLIISIDKVQDELSLNKDDLSLLCPDNLPADFFKDTTSVVATYGDVSNWAYSKAHHYNAGALNEFLSATEADAWLVAFAKANGNSIVTHEVSQPDGKKKVKIPDACAPFNITCVNTIEMFRHLGVQF